MRRNLVALVGLVAVLWLAYVLDRNVLLPLRAEAGRTFQPAASIWAATAAHIVMAAALLGFVWLFWSWTARSWTVAVGATLAGAYLVLLWPLAVSFQITNMPGAAALGLYLVMSGIDQDLAWVAACLLALGTIGIVSRAWSRTSQGGEVPATGDIPAR